MTTLTAVKDWRLRAACRREPDLWFDDHAEPSQLAVHVCRRHCPVTEQCQEEVRKHAPEWGVQAGLQWTRRGGRNRPSGLQPAQVKCRRECVPFMEVDGG